MTNSPSFLLDPATRAALHVGIWIASATAVLIFAQLCVWLVKTIRGSAEPRRIEPQPLMVGAAPEYVTASACRERMERLNLTATEAERHRVQDAKDNAASRSAIYHRIEDVQHEIADVERRLNAADEARTSALHDRINDLLTGMAEVRGAIQELSKQRK